MKLFDKIKKALPVVAAVAVLAVPAALATYIPTLKVTQGGTGATSAGDARTNLGAAASGANADITSITGLTTMLATTQGGTGADNAADARTNLGAAASGANADITSITGLTTMLATTQGGTGADNAADARTNLGAAASGANSDITSLSGLTTALSVAQGGTGLTDVDEGDILYASADGVIGHLAHGSDGQVLKLSSGLPAWADSSATYTVTPHSSAGTAAAGFNTCDATGGAFALTLPAAPVTGTEVVAKKMDVSTNAVTVTRAGTQTIDGATTFVLSDQFQSVTLVYTASNVWSIE